LACIEKEQLNLNYQTYNLAQNLVWVVVRDNFTTHYICQGTRRKRAMASSESYIRPNKRQAAERPGRHQMMWELMGRQPGVSDRWWWHSAMQV